MTSSATPPPAAETFAQHRPRLVRAAYQLLGSVSDAEDVAQETWLRWARVDHASVADPLAYLIRVSTRLALDRLRRRKAARETYPGEWLPEPVATGPTVEESALASESLSMAMMLLLETLSPLERAVFVLREAFDLPYSEIGEVLDRSEEAARQLGHRARRHVEERRPRYTVDEGAPREVVERFVAAARTGDLGTLLDVLAPDVTLIADSGGKVRAPLLPVAGADKVGRFLLSVAARELPAVEIEVATINGAPGIVVRDGPTAVAVLHVEVTGERALQIYLQANPDKLAGMSRLDGVAASSD
jgi:RNA polymerase sigma-70 factor, ECF subfamily